MKFAEDKRRLLGRLALLAPLPLPFNDVLEWPLLLLYEALVVVFLFRARDPAARWLPPWSMNVLGLLYVPVLILDAQLIFARGQVVQTMIHLCMFTVLAKLYSLRLDRDVSISLGAIFFLFLSGMGTSVHPTVLLYLLLFGALAFLTLLRLTQYRLLTNYGWKGAPPRVPLGRFVAFGMVVAVALSIPLFALFPRVRNPMIGMRGVGTGTVIHAAGFTDDVTLDSIGAMRSNPEVAVRLRYPEGRGPDGELRLKGATFDTYKNRRWEPTPRRNTTLVPQGTAVRLAEVEPQQWLDIWRQPMNTRSLFLPAETVALEVVAPVLGWDRGGAVYLLWGASGVLTYRVGLAQEAVHLAQRPVPAEREPALDTSALAPRISELAGQVAVGATAPAEVATRLERHLMDRYAYSERFVGLTGARPLEDFLFRHQQGHCELFASALVLMLRSQGIPARLVTGFLGGELNPLTGYYVVRQGNAHAWVEAYLPDTGWRTFDPTPPAGRPDADILARWTLFHQVSDYLQFRWDRYVLTYGFQDQLSAMWRLRALFGRIRGWFGEGDEAGGSGVAQEAGAGTATDFAADDGPAPAQDPRSLAFRIFFGLLAVALLGWLVVQRLRAVGTATEAFRRLRRQAAVAGIPLVAGTAPLELARRLSRRFPEARAATGRVVRLYLRESFGGYSLTDKDRGHLLEAFRSARRSMARKQPIS